MSINVGYVEWEVEEKFSIGNGNSISEKSEEISPREISITTSWGIKWNETFSFDIVLFHLYGGLSSKAQRFVEHLPDLPERTPPAPPTAYDDEDEDIVVVGRAGGSWSSSGIKG